MEITTHERKQLQLDGRFTLPECIGLHNKLQDRLRKQKANEGEVQNWTPILLELCRLYVVQLGQYDHSKPCFLLSGIDWEGLLEIAIQIDTGSPPRKPNYI